jgi:hypothetical protein
MIFIGEFLNMLFCKFIYLFVSYLTMFSVATEYRAEWMDDT